MSQSENEFLNNYDKSSYEKPSITADVLTFSIDMSDDKYNLQILLLERNEHPYKGNWSLPGGFMGISETLEDTAMRVCRDKTGLDMSYLEQLYTFSDVDRDPRMRIVSATYLNLINKYGAIIHNNCKWFNLEIKKSKSSFEDSKLYEIIANNKETVLKATCLVKKIANPNRLEKTMHEIKILNSDFSFDHAKMICLGYLRIFNKINYTNVAFHFMEETFTLPSLQKVYECILQKELYKTSFRTHVKDMILDTGQKTKVEGFSKPSKLYIYNGGYEL